ncbi:MAG: hypothetical protein ACK4MG_08465 [Aquabacterium sp.]
MKQFKIVLAMVAAALGLSALIVYFGQRGDASAPVGEASGLPWQVDALPEGGSRVFGLTLMPAGQPGGSTLGDARQRWGDTMQIAVIAAPGEDGTLEAYVDPAPAGFINGKLVITARMAPEAIRGLRERALKAEFMESTTRKYQLAPADLPQALAAPIAALGFIPAANLDEAAVQQRFGAAAEQVRRNDHMVHHLYPARGLDLVLDTQGKELLQYVAPAEFETRLRQPLKAAVAASAASAASAARAQ